MNNVLCSIIIPVYNVEKYIDRCINSVLAQTYSCTEIICVDDGSTDASGEICDSYIGDKVKVVHVTNGGVAKARQIGLEESNGEFVLFVDSDDWLPKNSIELLLSQVSDNVDVVGGGIIQHD